MDPTCSWWNSAQLQVGPEYVLQHEQIHFALLEISAREINREIAKLRIRVPSRDRASAIAEASLKQVLEAARDRYVSQGQRFDEQTSPRPDREAQSRWQREVEARLSDRERGAEK
jgi:predicted secreted Zn-dependent protease